MANQYTLFNNGTFELGTATLSFRNAGQSTVIGNAVDSNLDAFEGVKSLRVHSTIPYFGGPSNNAYGHIMPYLRVTTGGGPNVISLVVGNKYRARCRVKTPSGAPIANPEAMILLGGFSISGLQVSQLAISTPSVGKRRFLYTGPGTNGAFGFIEMTGTYVSNATDSWIELEYIWIEQPGTSMVNYLTVSVELYKININGTNPAATLDLTVGGTVNNQILANGDLFIDKITIDQVIGCDLALGVPSYTKTDETAEDADDGSITANATSSFTREYSLDGVTWQLSNNFPGLAPGTYTVFIRDSNGCTTQIDDITINPFVPGPPPPPPAPGPLVINSKPVNRYNFISWYTSVGTTTFTSIECFNCCWDLPKGYDVDKDFQRFHAPIMAWNEVNAFYINFDIPATDPTFSDFRLGLFNQSGMVNPNIGALSRHDVTTDNYNIYAGSVIIPDSVAPGVYRMMIYRLTDGVVLWTSNDIEVMDSSIAPCESVKLEYRHSYNIYKYYYELFDSNFLNRIRLRLYRIDENTEGELVQYRGASNGRLRNRSFELDKFIVLEAYWFDDLAHRGMFVLQVHGLIAVNDVLYLPKSLYKREFDAKKKLDKGRLELFEQDFSTANRYKPLTTITLIGSEDPLLLGNTGFLKL